MLQYNTTRHSFICQFGPEIFSHPWAAHLRKGGHILYIQQASSIDICSRSETETHTHTHAGPSLLTQRTVLQPHALREERTLPGAVSTCPAPTASPLSAPSCWDKTRLRFFLYHRVFYTRSASLCWGTDTISSLSLSLSLFLSLSLSLFIHTHLHPVEDSHLPNGDPSKTLRDQCETERGREEREKEGERESKRERERERA